MTDGTLYYGSVNAAEYIRDKRDPQVFDEELHRLRFVPDDSSKKETWIINGAIHCVGNGAAGTVLTGDYPYYMEKYINETAGANYFYIQGAELAISNKSDGITPEPADVEKYGNRYATLMAYGKRLGELVCSITDETVVSPILNVKYSEVFVPISNNILVLAAKCGLLLNKVVRNGFKYEVVTEIGYAEFGSSLAVAIMPGELAPRSHSAARTPQRSHGSVRIGTSPPSLTLRRAGSSLYSASPTTKSATFSTATAGIHTSPRMRR